MTDELKHGYSVPLSVFLSDASLKDHEMRLISDEIRQMFLLLEHLDPDDRPLEFSLIEAYVLAMRERLISSIKSDLIKFPA